MKLYFINIQCASKAYIITAFNTDVSSIDVKCPIGVGIINVIKFPTWHPFEIPVGGIQLTRNTGGKLNRIDVKGIRCNNTGLFVKSDGSQIRKINQRHLAYAIG